MRRKNPTRWTAELLGAALLLMISGDARADARAPEPAAAPETAPGPDHVRSESVVVGKVTDLIHAGRYTYVEVESAEGRVWAAGPRVDVQVGESVYFPKSMPMPNFESNTLGRTFDLLYMVDAIRVVSAGSTTKASPRPEGGVDAGATSVEPPPGGYTVAQIFEQGAELSGSEIAVRGRVIKFNPRIMGRNWVHLQDGTAGPGGANDLVVTTAADVEEGAIVLVRGRVVTDKDFGSGYRFDVLIEEATLEVEGTP